MTSITADGATDTIYILETDGTPIYRINSGMWFGLTFPLTIANTNGTPASNILKVLFMSDLTITSDIGYIRINSDGIQIGNTTVNDDGTKTTITIDGVTDYGGFIENNLRNDSYIFNIHVAAVNGTNLASGNGGWIGRQGYGTDGTNNFIIGCSSDGDIPADSGGIVGSQTARASPGGSATLTIVGCSSSGTIGNSAGGIVGSMVATEMGAVVTIIKCSSSASTIGMNGGGIIGSQAGIGGGTCSVQKCYSMGTIGGNAGGIVGAQAGYAGGTVYVTDSYSRGDIQPTGGGIYGGEAATSGGVANATNCYSSGIVSTSGNGIFGTDPKPGYNELSCYVANGTWITSAANSAMDISPFITITLNQPFELRNIGPSPYSLTTIDVGDEDMTLTYSESVAAGSSSIAAVLAGLSSFSILEIDGESPAETPTITINSSTGVISTTSETFVGTYTIVARAITNSYSITSFELTVTEGPPPAPVIVVKKVLVQDASSYIASKRISVNSQGANGIDPVKLRAPYSYSFYKPYYKTNIVPNGPE